MNLMAPILKILHSVILVNIVTMATTLQMMVALTALLIWVMSVKMTKVTQSGALVLAVQNVETQFLMIHIQ